MLLHLTHPNGWVTPTVTPTGAKLTGGVGFGFLTTGRDVENVRK